MHRKQWLLFSLICCLSLLMVACSWLGLGKSHRATIGAGQNEPAKGVEAAKPGSGEIVWKDDQEWKWESYAADGNAVEYFAEKGTISYPSSTLVHAWRKREFPRSSAQKEIIAFDEIDCNTAEYRSLEVKGIYWDGKTTLSKKASPWTRIWFSTPDEVFYEDACTAARHSR